MICVVSLKTQNWVTWIKGNNKPREKNTNSKIINNFKIKS